MSTTGAPTPSAVSGRTVPARSATYRVPSGPTAAAIGTSISATWMSVTGTVRSGTAASVGADGRSTHGAGTVGPGSLRANPSDDGSDADATSTVSRPSAVTVLRTQDETAMRPKARDRPGPEIPSPPGRGVVTGAIVYGGNHDRATRPAADRRYRRCRIRRGQPRPEADDSAVGRRRRRG